MYVEDSNAHGIIWLTFPSYVNNIATDNCIACQQYLYSKITGEYAVFPSVANVTLVASRPLMIRGKLNYKKHFQGKNV